MTKVFRRAIFCSYFLLVILFFAACSNFYIPQDSESSQGIAQVGGEEDLPYSMTILEELHDGEQLHVKTRLYDRAGIQGSDAEIWLRGIQDGEVVEEKSVALSSLKEVRGAADANNAKVYDAVLSIAADNLSDYQVELVWGQGVEDMPAMMTALVLKQIKLNKRLLCSTSPCKISYSIEGKLYNAGNSLIKLAEIGVGYVFVQNGVELDLSGIIPENEELLQLSGLDLAAGHTRPFKLRLKQEVPEREDGVYTPVIRIVSYQ